MRETARLEASGVPLDRIRNRNEARVAALLGEVLAEDPDWSPDFIDIQDIYALTLNKLPAHYVQPETIIIRKQHPVSDDDIRAAIRDARDRVRTNPNH